MPEVEEYPPSQATDRRSSVRVLTVTDLHQRGALYAQLAEAVLEHRPDAVVLVGDFLHGLEPEAGMHTVAECAQQLAALPVEQLIFVRGNHEHHQFTEFAAALSSTNRKMSFLHGEADNVGPLTILGFDCFLGDDTAFTFTKSPLPPTPGAWVPKLVRKLGPAARAVWVAHEPPSGTVLSAVNGPLAGNPEWRELIERFSPRVFLCGHDHDTPINRKRWYDRIGDSLIVNVGQTNCKRLHFCLVDADFSSPISALPSKITLQAFPWGEQLVLGPVGAPLRSAPFQDSDR